MKITNPLPLDLGEELHECHREVMNYLADAAIRHDKLAAKWPPTDHEAGVTG